MGFLIALLVLFIFFRYLARPLLLWYLKRKARRYFGQNFGGFDGRPNDDRQRQAHHSGSPQPEEHKKKIDKDVGEYVKFEEISVSESTFAATDSSESSSTERVEVEQQIVDVEWEDIK